VQDYQTAITVPASGATVPSSLKRIIVRAEVAGRVFEQVLNAQPNQIAQFALDGLDCLGRQVHGSIPVTVSVGFVYDGVYWQPGNYTPSFGMSGRAPSTIFTRQEIILWKRSNLTVFKPIGIIGEGWTISPHHFFSLTDPSTLHKGDGSLLKNNTLLIDTVAGNGAGGFNGDGGLATQANVGFPVGMAEDVAGNFYFATSGRVRKVDKNGIITTVAGTGVAGSSGDNGPAIQAQLNAPDGVAVDGAGNIYISEQEGYRVRKVDLNGIITTIVGTGTPGYSGDGGPATQAQIGRPAGLTLDAAGNLYIAVWYYSSNTIRKVDANGIITTFAGTGSGGYNGDGGLAIQAKLYFPLDVTVDASGNLYIADSHNMRIRKVDPSGIITTFAGSGSTGFNGDGGLATQATLWYPSSVTVDSGGNLYILDNYNERIRKVDSSGIITTIAGTGVQSYGGDKGPAIEANFHWTYTFWGGIGTDPKGYLYICDMVNHRVRKTAPPAAFDQLVTGGDIPFADENGLGYIMASSGRHKNTIDLATGKILYSFGYDINNNLTSITDQFNNQTVINRDSNGVPVSIISPDSLSTSLTIDANNHLTRITYPDSTHYDFEYTTGGLMTKKIEPKGNQYAHAFDATGRLTNVADQEGGLWQYYRTTYPNGDILTQVLTGEGNQTAYQDHTFSTGAYTSTIIDSTAAETLFSQSADGLSVEKSLPCGMTLNFTYDLDQEYKLKFVKQAKETTPANLIKTTLTNKTYQDTNADGIKDLITETISVNNKTTTLIQNTLQHQKTVTSPVGRTITTLYDPNTLLTQSVSIPGLYPTTFGYDTKGRLTSTTANTRQSSFAYNAQGFLASVTDPANHTTTYDHDVLGRVIVIHRPDTGIVGFTYDQNSNMTVLTNPAIINHGFGYNNVNLNSSYTAPLSGSYSYLYDKDRRLKQTNFPSGKTIKNIYDTIQLSQIQTPEGNIDFTYLCSTKIGSVAKGTESITYGYDGSLITSETQTGTLNKSLSYTYNNDFNPTGFTYAGATENYVYDNDGLLTGAGPFTIGRNANNGLPVSVTGGSLSLARTFNGYGEVAGETTTVNGMGQGAWGLTKDNTGRITDKAETINGVTANYHYTYDPMGRLLTVTQGGTLIEEYQYNATGTRTSEVNTLRGIAGRNFTYSDEDHCLTSGSTTYQYDVDGFLTVKTVGTDLTHYSYSSCGELLSVTLPNSTLIEYVHDPLGRRIAKKVNGVITEKYLWQGLTRLLAVYDGGDNLMERFIYADGRMPFAMTSGGNTYYLTYDQVGSLRVISNASGNVVKQLDYDSFGNIIADTNPSLAIPFGFAGGLHDQNTGLVRFGYRDYDPDIGRWTAKDPILFKSGDTDLFGYCLSNPINLFDPDGRILPLIAVGAGVGAIIGGGMYALTTNNFTWGGFAGAVGAGAIAGGVGVVAPAIAGSLGLGSGFAGTAAANALAGIAGAGFSAALDPCQDFTLGYAASSGAFGALGGYGAQKFLPTQGMSNFGQVGFPRTLSGVWPRPLGGSAGPNAINAIYAGSLVSVGVGSAGPAALQ